MNGTSKVDATKSQNPLRICFVIDDLAVAGTESQLLALIKHLDRRQFAPQLCLLRGRDQASRELEPQDCPVMRLGVGSLKHPKTILKLLQFALWLKRERINVVQTYFADSSYIGITAGWIANISHRIRSRNNLGHWMSLPQKRLGSFLNLLTTTSITNCEAARIAIIRSENTSPRSIQVMPNGVDIDRFAQIPFPTKGTIDEPTVGVVANLRAVKGLDVFIKAAAGLKRQFANIRFYIAGEGTERKHLEHLICTQQLENTVRLLGRQQDIPSFLSLLDVAVLPSKSEGMSNSLLEYMAAARPIVATNVGAASELIENEVSGILVPPNDALALQRAISRLLTNKELARSLAMTARKRAVEKYNRPTMINRFAHFYSTLRSQSEGKRPA